MQKIIAITGITGQQGGGVVDAMLGAGWKVRGITRDTNSAKAKALAARGIDMMAADFGDEESLRDAFEGAHAVFAMTNMFDHVWAKGKTTAEAAALEEEDAMRLARAAAATESLEHYIFSTLPSATELSNGACPVTHLDSKARADARIRQTMPELASRMTSLWFGFYPSNFLTPMFRPLEVPGSLGKHILVLPCSPSAAIETTGDMDVTPGIWVRQILANPDKSMGAYASVATELCTFGEMLNMWSETTGKSGVFVTCSAQEFENIWGPGGGELALQLRFNDTIKDWTAQNRDKYVSREDLDITDNEAKGFKHALQVLKEEL